MSSSSARPSIWNENRRPVLTGRSLAPAFEFVYAVTTEYRRAMAAARRYEQLKHRPKTCGNRTADLPRQVYMEFYSEV